LRSWNDEDCYNKDAETKLNEEMRHYRGDKAPVGEFVSRLIEMCPDELWKQVRDRMVFKYEVW
jgi:hypothetical protein